jgi:hypothetical protein
MSPTKNPSRGDKPGKTIEEQITEIANRMKRAKPTELLLLNGDVYKLEDVFLDRFAIGNDFAAEGLVYAWHCPDLQSKARYQLFSTSQR